MKLTKRFLLVLCGFIVVFAAFDIINGRDIFRPHGSPVGAGIIALLIGAPVVIALDLARRALARRAGRELIQH